jgi:hypothetical protein
MVQKPRQFELHAFQAWHRARIEAFMFVPSMRHIIRRASEVEILFIYTA